MRNDFQMREKFAKGTMPARNKKTLDLQSLEQV